jgi:glycine cleavage system H protein
MSEVPGDLKYSRSHEWARCDGDVATIGITDHAQSELGDVVYLDLPEPGRIVQAESQLGEIESVKAVSPLYSPVSGEVIEVNEALKDKTEAVNEDPYGVGWIAKVKMSKPDELSGLLDPADYVKHIAEGEE